MNIVYVSYIMFHSDLFVNDTYVYKYTHSSYQFWILEYIMIYVCLCML